MTPSSGQNNHLVGGIVFVGAMNVDGIVHEIDRIQLSDLADSIGSDKLLQFSETAVSDLDIQVLLNCVPKEKLRFQLGGGAFNAARAASLVAHQSRLGFVGVSGRYLSENPHKKYLAQRGVDCSFVMESSNDAALSLAFVYGGDRTLVTAQGSNAEVACYLEKYFEELVLYISKYSTVHLTPYFDQAATVVLLKVLRAVLRINPGINICVDPGTVWSCDPSEAAQAIISMSNILILSEPEFLELGGKLSGETNSDCAARIFKVMRQSEVRTVVVRSHKTATVFSYENAVMLQIEARAGQKELQMGAFDPTGAGDTFSGIYLALNEFRAFGLGVSAAVSLRAASQKVQHFGEIEPSDLEYALADLSVFGLTFDGMVRNGS